MKVKRIMGEKEIEKMRKSAATWSIVTLIIAFLAGALTLWSLNFIAPTAFFVGLSILWTIDVRYWDTKYYVLYGGKRK